MSPKYIYAFGAGKAEADASPEMIHLLGNKGAQLHQMTAMGLPVPPGFTISTEVCDYYFENKGALPQGLMDGVAQNMRRVEEINNLKFGDVDKDPLLVSARSGAAVSMPGMMETILNLGLTAKAMEAYIQRHNSEESASRFILDCYRRLYEMFGQNVYAITKEDFRDIFDGLKEEVGVVEDTQLKPEHLRILIERYQKLYDDKNAVLPQEPMKQLEDAIKAVEESAMGEKARNFRKAENLPEKIYTGVNVQTMVYGNENNDNCGTGVGFSRDPSTGIKDRENPYGEYLLGGQGEDVVSGRRNVFPINDMKKTVPEAYADLMRVCDLLEEKTKRVQDFEFTVWRGKLYMLQTRNGKLTGRANIRSCYDMAQEGLIDTKTAIGRVTPDNLSQLLHRMIDYDAMKEDGVGLADVLMNPGDVGVAASPGGGVGRVAFDVAAAVEYHEKGEPAILCRIETDPADYPGMVISQAVATARGGKTSHAAVVARNKGIPCAAGTGIDIDERKKQMSYTNSKGEKVVINEGDFISVDGSIGKVLNYQAKLTMPKADDPDLQNFLKVLYPVAKMRVYANANDAEEAARAVQFGAEGIGLARTEYMFLDDRMAGENRAVTIGTWVLAEDKSIRQNSLTKLEEMQTRDFLGIYRVMKDKPTFIRLMDYPLHELLSGAQHNLEALVKVTGMSAERLTERIASYHEVNPMLGHRSVRLGITHPEVFAMQVRAIMKAAAQVNSESNDGKYVTPYIEIPLVFSANEVKVMAGLVKTEADKLTFSRGGNSTKNENRYRLGIMYELSGAAFEGAELAKYTDFGSFGTNDLTQSVLGWSREDGSTTFLPKYVNDEILAEDPFITIDKNGPVAKAMALAVLFTRSSNEDYELGICGEHAADPASLEVCYGVGLNNVSPAPNQVPIAWLRSAQLSLTDEYGGMLKQFAEFASANFGKVIKTLG